jgi:alanyl-tRNA synthetase
VPGLTVHRIVTHAPIRVGEVLEAVVARPLRDATRRNHTATHLLHASLRQVLGMHVKQAGSVVEPARLRFDFTHYAALDKAEIEEVERLMNEQILRNRLVETNIMPLDQAIATGAMALFGEKYGDQVRVVTVPEFSRELCGGTHVNRTGDIGVCKVVSESSISAGVRRIEAITGEAALRQYQESMDALRHMANLLRVSEAELTEQIEKLQAREHELQRQLNQSKDREALVKAASLVPNGDQRPVIERVDGMDRQQMRLIADALRNRRIPVVVLASAQNGDVAIVAAVRKDLTGKFHAGKLAASLAQAVGGKGGGRPDMAEAGGKDASALNAALEKLRRDVEGQL